MNIRLRLIAVGLVSLAGCVPPDGPTGQKASPAQSRQLPPAKKRTAATKSAKTAKTATTQTGSSATKSTGGPTKYALLVGCTDYPFIDPKFNLIGPANDVLLTRDLLVEKFDFPPENVVTLSDKDGRTTKLPSRKNIERYWRKLGDIARPGDQIVVLMAGHGSQCPQRPDDPNDVEPDGLDELFLPRDIGPWNDTAGTVENAIKDDELRQWVARINQQGASLFVIIDACHSGTMTRTDGTKRELDMKTLAEAAQIPAKYLEEAKAIAEQASDEEKEEEVQLFPDEQPATRGAGGSSQTPKDAPVTVALFASQSIEPTIEMKLPAGSPDARSYGLLTYTLNKILSEAESKMTYRELAQRIHKQYRDWKRTGGPTPVIEGNGLDRVVLGLETFPDRPQIRIRGDQKNGFKIDEGALGGITRNSVLAVYPQAGAANADQPIGHVRVLAAGFDAVEARVEPCEYEGLAAPANLEEGMRCRTVYVDFGDQRLRFGVDNLTEQSEPLPDDLLEPLASAVKAPLTELAPLVQSMPDPDSADWLLRYDTLASKQLFLVPASGWHGEQAGALPPLFGPAPAGEAFADWLKTALASISRVESLLRISSEMSGELGATADFYVDLVRYKSKEDKKSGGTGEVVEFGRSGMKLYDGQFIEFRVKNTGKSSLDVTILFIDSAYGIHPLFPKPGETNRLYPGNPFIEQGTISAKTVGKEHLVVIAVKSSQVEEPVDYTFLAQPNLAQAREADSDPLSKLFQNAMYGKGEMRGLSYKSDAAKYQIQTLSWTTLPTASK